MFIAMNRFKVSIGKEDQFEIIWKTRKSNLQTVAGFISFNLLRSDTFETYTLYASHTEWHSKEDFINWTKSDSFKESHKGAGKHSDLYNEHPNFEGFESII